VGPSYLVMSFLSIGISVRQEGEFARKKAVAALGFDPKGKVELLGIWIGPAWKDASPKDVSPVSFSEAMEALRVKKREFWQQVFGDLKKRGCEKIVLCYRDLPSAYFFTSDLFEGQDEAALEMYPGMILLPNVSTLIDESVPFLILKLDEIHDIPRELRAVLQAPTSAAARGRLDWFAEKWAPRGERYQKISVSLLKVWGLIEPLFGLSGLSRRVLDEVDSFIRTTGKMADDASGARGAASDDDAALSETSDDLLTAMKMWKQGANWQEFADVLDRQSRR